MGTAGRGGGPLATASPGDCCTHLIRCGVDSDLRGDLSGVSCDCNTVAWAAQLEKSHPASWLKGCCTRGRALPAAPMTALPDGRWGQLAGQQRGVALGVCSQRSLSALWLVRDSSPR